MSRLVLSAVAALCLSACTMTDQSVDGIESPREKALYSAVEAYTSAYLSGNGELARQYVAAECKGEIDPEKWDENSARLGREYVGAKMDSYDARIWEGLKADVSYDFGDVPFAKKNERWVWSIDIGWVNAGC